MMARFLLLLLCIPFISIGQTAQDDINTVLNTWHKAASEADFDKYFSQMTDDSVFLGTDATENWNYEEFKEFAKPYFDKGKAWSFTAVERNIFVDSSGETAWFDEHLSTQMGICRGSGVLKMNQGTWKIAHYVLSIAVPNENVSTLTALKSDWDANHIQKLKSEKH